METSLFNKQYLSDYMSGHEKSLLEYIGKLEITENDNIPALTEKVKQKFTIHPIILGTPQPSEPKETTRQMPDVFGRYYSQKVFEIIVSIPFEGDLALFYCQPQYSQIVYLDEGVTINRIRETNVTATIILTQLDESVYSSRLGSIIKKMESNLPQIEEAAKPWTYGLENLIRCPLEARKEAVFKKLDFMKLDFMKKIGLKENPKST